MRRDVRSGDANDEFQAQARWLWRRSQRDADGKSTGRRMLSSELQQIFNMILDLLDSFFIFFCCCNYVNFPHCGINNVLLLLLDVKLADVREKGAKV